MNDDQFLRDRLRQAADAAGSHADPARAHGIIAQGPVAASVLGPKLWLLGALAVTGLVVGTLLGFTVLSPEATSAASTAVLDRRSGTVYDCPGGDPVGTLRPGDRVYSVGRNEAGDWSAIRDPRRAGSTVWVPTAALVLDEEVDLDVVDCDHHEVLAAPGAPAETTLPDPGSDPDDPADPADPDDPDGPAATVDPDDPTPPSTAGPGPTGPAPPGPQAPTTRPTPTTQAPPTSSPGTPTTAGPPPDTTAPTVSPVGGADPPEIYRSAWAPYCDVSTQLTVRAADAVGVTSVTGTYASGLPGSPIAFSRIGGSARDGTWRATFGPFSTNLGGSRNVPITVTARDGAGNSRATTITVTYHSTCLI